jgi:indolepyruvate ferredoxin oxidoreductase alpha subunit
MKRLADMLLEPGGFEEFAMGNIAMARAMIEAGVRTVTSYPGSPTPEIADAIASIPAERRPFYFEFSTNEKVALEVAFGSAVDGRTSVCFFKSVGLNVAADSFVQLPMMDISGGMVVILGDDPGANSSQNEQDNRHIAKMAYAPLFEPSGAAEAYRLLKEAIALAREIRGMVVLRLTTHVCHMKETIAFDALPPERPASGERFTKERAPLVPIAKTVFPMKARALSNLERVRDRGEGTCELVDRGNRARGVIAAGLPRLALADAMADAAKAPDVLGVALVNPPPRDAIASFLETHDEVLVLEELDPILEDAVKAIAWERKAKVRLLGKRGDADRMGEYLPGRVAEMLHDIWPDDFPRGASRAVGAELPPVGARPPQLCPGCGHRSAFFAVKAALGPSDLTVADIGCHSLGYLPPYEMGRVLLSMGHAPSTSSGIALERKDAPIEAGERRVVCFLGDSTFFHAGLPAIANAVFNRHDVLLVLMENGTTAMTGHQDHPAVGRNFNGASEAIPVRRALEGLGATNIREVDAYKQPELTQAVREALAERGFRVVIAKHPCMLKLTRAARKRPGYAPRYVKVDQDTCTRAYVCAARFACPSFQRLADGSVAVSRELCIGDGSCRQTCPSGAIVEDGGRQ